WLGTPAPFPRIQHEAAIRLLAADFVPDETTLAALRPLRGEIERREALLAESEAAAHGSRTGSATSCSNCPSSAGCSGRIETGSTSSSESSGSRLAPMSPPADLRDWIRLLEREGELVRVGAEVDPDLELTEVVDRTVKAGGPALLFERPKGSAHALLINQFGTERRMCLAFGAPTLDAVGARLEEIIEMQPPQG